MQIGPSCSVVVNRVLKKLQTLADRERAGEALDQADIKAMVNAQLEMLSVLDTLVQATAADVCIPVEWPADRATTETPKSGAPSA
jgi:hypothetical protein